MLDLLIKRPAVDFRAQRADEAIARTFAELRIDLMDLEMVAGTRVHAGKVLYLARSPSDDISAFESKVNGRGLRWEVVAAKRDVMNEEGVSVPEYLIPLNEPDLLKWMADSEGGGRPASLPQLQRFVGSNPW